MVKLRTQTIKLYFKYDMYRNFKEGDTVQYYAKEESIGLSEVRATRGAT